MNQTQTPMNDNLSIEKPIHCVLCDIGLDWNDETPEINGFGRPIYFCKICFAKKEDEN